MPESALQVHLIDGTYELFRQHFGRASGGEVGRFSATVGVLTSTLQLLADGATHVGVASDHVIESFRNDLWPGYKTGEGVPPEIMVQIPVMEVSLRALGVTVWPMVTHEADDALAAAAAVAGADARVGRVIICTPDKDLGQCVRGTRVVQLDRRKGETLDEEGIRAKFGVGPESIADYLGLVGDTADGYPGLPGWGAKSASAVLARYGRIEEIPDDDWDVAGLRGAAKLAATLRENRDLALLFRRVATVDIDLPVGAVDDWRWQGPLPELEEVCARLEAPGLVDRARRAAEGR